MRKSKGRVSKAGQSDGPDVMDAVAKFSLFMEERGLDTAEVFYISREEIEQFLASYSLAVRNEARPLLVGLAKAAADAPSPDQRPPVSRKSMAANWEQFKGMIN